MTGEMAMRDGTCMTKMTERAGLGRWLLAGGLLAGGLLGAALPQAAAGQTTVRIVSGQAAQNGDVLRQEFDAFNAANTDVKVKLELDNRSDVDTTQKVLADIAAGAAPDAVRVTGAVLRAYIDSGRAQPLDACLASAPALAAQLDANLMAGARVDGKTYQIPWYVTLPALFINTRAFVAAGLDPAKPPRTWHELEAAAAKLSDPAKGKYGLLMYMPNTYLFESQLESAGGRMVGPDGRSALDSPQALAVMTFMRSLVQKGYMPTLAPGAFWTSYAPMFSSGDVAMFLFSASSSTSLAKGADFDVTIAPIPIQDGGATVATSSVNGFVMLATDPVRQAATCKALLTLLTPGNVALTVKATATSPLNTVAAATPGLLGDYYKAHPALAAINAQHAGAWYSLPGRGNGEFQKVFGDIQYEILTGATEPKAGLEKLSARMDALLAGR